MTDVDAAPGWVRAYIGLGANLGAARAQVEAAVEALGRLPQVRLVAVSPLYRSAPLDADGPDYVNAVAALDSVLAAEALLDALQAVERRFGRTRPYANAPRTLDLDLLSYGSVRSAGPRLVLPHPRLALRAFVLEPWADIAADAQVPGLGSVRALRDALRTQAHGRAQRLERLDAAVGAAAIAAADADAVPPAPTTPATRNR
jgi:2-amino-4-hydroxy-6-hydroxymethyldihydropteridine diphosphokinase